MKKSIIIDDYIKVRVRWLNNPSAAPARLFLLLYFVDLRERERERERESTHHKEL